MPSRAGPSNEGHVVGKTLDRFCRQPIQTSTRVREPLILDWPASHVRHAPANQLVFERLRVEPRRTEAVASPAVPRGGVVSSLVVREHVKRRFLRSTHDISRRRPRGDPMRRHSTTTHHDRGRPRNPICTPRGSPKAIGGVCLFLARLLAKKALKWRIASQDDGAVVLATTGTIELAIEPLVLINAAKS